MPLRKTHFVTGEYYHVFNRSINKEPIFVSSRDCQRAITAFKYYRFADPPTRLSYFLSLGFDRREKLLSTLQETNQILVEINSFCFMPNHFHFLLKQMKDGGISKFLRLFQNSYARFLSTKYPRQGHVFQGQFKAVRIEDDNQLLHVNRYIHLNPYTSFVVKTLDELAAYPYSSFPEYLSNTPSFCNKEDILYHFKNGESYKAFVFDRADYQRMFNEIRHLALD